MQKPRSIVSQRSVKYNLHDPQDAVKFWDNEWDAKYDPLGQKALKKVDFRIRGAHCYDPKNGYPSAVDATIALETSKKEMM